MGKCTSKHPKIIINDRSKLVTDQDESDPEIKSALILHKKPSDSEKQIISLGLKKNYLFCGLSEADLDHIFEHIRQLKVPKENLIFEQGSPGKNFYIVKSGKIEVYRNNSLKTVLQKGDTFGEMALLTNTLRRATLKAIEETSLFAISRPLFKSALNAIYTKHYEINKEFISNLGIFSGFSDDTKKLLTNSLIQHEYPDSHRILCEGDESLLLFILKEGSLVAKFQGVEKYRINKGEMFGQDLIFSESPVRNVSIFAVGVVQCLSIDKDSLISTIGENYKEIIYKTQARTTMSSDGTIGMIPKDQIFEIVEEMKWVMYQPGEIVIKKNPKYSKIYVLCVGVLRTNDVVIQLSEAFGFKNSNQKKLKSSELTAETESIVGIASKRLIEKATKCKCSELKRQLKITRFLMKVEILTGIGIPKLKYISSKVRLAEYDSKDIIFKYNDKSDCLYIIKKGSVEMYFEKKLLRVLGKYDIFGESCIESDIRKRTARASGNCQCLLLPADEFRSILDDHTLPQFQTRKSAVALFHLNELVKIKKIFKSKEKTIFTASLKGPSPAFQVIAIQKCSVDSLEKCNQLVQEKSIAMSSEHHFLLKFIKSFTDVNFIYLIYEFVEGAEFSSILNKPVLEIYAKLVTACIVSVIEYFHNKNYAYRDLCPENILIKNNGYIMLKNYSCPKLIKGRTLTRIGNPLFNSPEMIEGKGYTKSTDFWSLGILVYEMLYNQLPFGISKIDERPIEIYEKIMKGSLEFPHDSVMFKANEFLSSVLVKDPKDRAELKDFKYSKWLSSVDWPRVNSEADISPFKPNEAPKINKKQKSELISLQRYANEKLAQASLKHQIKFNWERYF